MYQTLAASGLRATQLDRAPALQAAPGNADAIAKAAEEIAAKADCVLVTHAQLSAAGAAFPYSAFGLLLQYVGPSLEEPTDAADDGSCAIDAVAAMCPGAGSHIQRVVLTAVAPDLGLPAEAQQPPAGAQPPAAPAVAPVQRKKAALAPAGLRQQLQGPLQDKEKVVTEQPAAADAKGPQTTSNSRPEWPLVITSRQNSVLRQRQSLYEAILQLEKRGASIVERPLATADAALSASCCVSIWTADMLQGDTMEDVILDALGPVLYSLSFAYSSVFLVIEASPAFCDRLAAAGPELLRVAQRVGLALQTLPCTCPQLMQDTIITLLGKQVDSQLASGGEPPHLTDSPSPAEAWLAAFPALNPFSAALLAALGPLRSLLTLQPTQQEVLAKSLPGVPAASLKLFFRQVNSGLPLTRPSHAGGQMQHNTIQQQPCQQQQQQQYQQLQQHAADEQPHWHGDAGGPFYDDGPGDAECRQATPPPMPQLERYQAPSPPPPLPGLDVTQPLSPASDDSSYLAVPPMRGPQARRQRFAGAAADDQYNDHAVDGGAGFAEGLGGGQPPPAWSSPEPPPPKRPRQQPGATSYHDLQQGYGGGRYLPADDGADEFGVHMDADLNVGFENAQPTSHRHGGARRAAPVPSSRRGPRFEPPLPPPQQRLQQDRARVHRRRGEGDVGGGAAGPSREASQGFGLGFDRDWDPLTVLQNHLDKQKAGRAKTDGGSQQLPPVRLTVERRGRQGWDALGSPAPSASNVHITGSPGGRLGFGGAFSSPSLTAGRRRHAARSDGWGDDSGWGGQHPAMERAHRPATFSSPANQEDAWASENEGFGPWEAGSRRRLGRSTDSLQGFDNGGGESFGVAAHPDRVQAAGGWRPASVLPAHRLQQPRNFDSPAADVFGGGQAASRTCHGQGLRDGLPRELQHPSEFLGVEFDEQLPARRGALAVAYDPARQPRKTLGYGRALGGDPKQTQLMWR